MQMQLNRPSNRPQLTQLIKQCGHQRHVGTCPVCQRMQLAKWQAQLAQAGTAHPKAA